MVFIQGLPSMKSRSKWAVDSPSLTWWQTCGATGVITVKSFQHLPTSVKRRFGHKWLLGPGPPLTPWLWYSNIVCHSDLHLSFKARSGYAKQPAAAVRSKTLIFSQASGISPHLRRTHLDANPKETHQYRHDNMASGFQDEASRAVEHPQNGSSGDYILAFIPAQMDLV